MIAYFVGPKEAKPVEINDENHLEGYYSLLNCNTIDIVQKSVGGKEFDVIVDDEGLLKDNPVASAFNKEGEPILFGNILFCNHDGEGNEASLSEMDIAILQEFTDVAYIVNTDGETIGTTVVIANMEE